MSLHRTVHRALDFAGVHTAYQRGGWVQRYQRIVDSALPTPNNPNNPPPNRLRYSRFDALYESMVCVLDARGRDATDLPSLPAKKFLGRSHVRKVAEERIAPLNVRRSKTTVASDQGYVHTRPHRLQY